MFETLSIFPWSFWLAAAVLAAGFGWGLRNLANGSGIPMLAVLGTVAFWYFGDAFYNDYRNYHAVLFESDTLQAAWLEVSLFIVVFCALTSVLHKQVNQRTLVCRSGVVRLFKRGIAAPEIQKQLSVMVRGMVAVWVILFAIAAIRLKGELIYYLFPFLGHKAEPWGRDGVGGRYDALFSLAFYLQQLVAALSGVAFALSNERRVRSVALCLCLVTWPYFIFERVRNSILAIVIPGILAWVFLRFRGGLLKKALVLALCFCVVNFWMGFVIANRLGTSIASAFAEKGFGLKSDKHRHEGLNMFEELCWMNTFFKQGTYDPTWGARFWSEIVNPVPRALWSGKPMIGIDYAIARGCAGGGGGPGSAGVFATMSTGLIGGGLDNFGRILGPAFAALLMSLWAVLLARLDINIERIGHLCLYPLGLILTFNLGRDITLITLYPFVFGMVGLSVTQHYLGRRSHVPRVCLSRTPSAHRRLLVSKFDRRKRSAMVHPPQMGAAGRGPEMVRPFFRRN